MRLPIRRWLPAWALAFVTLLPFLPGLLRGRCLYFRDLSLYFFPLRRFVVEGLLQGQVRYWNPYLHEGKQELFAPVSYPLDLLQVLWPDERGFTLLLALHVPLAALTFRRLAHELGFASVAATGAATVYALGGFLLSLVNLYDFVQAAAWVPLLVWGMMRAGEGARWGTTATALGALMVVSPGRTEIALQGMLLGWVLSVKTLPGLRRQAGGILLGLGLAAPLIVVQWAALAASGREAGLPTAQVVADSVHPVTLLQTMIGNVHADLSNVVGRFWGQRFFTRGSPYFLSFYLGPLVIALAAVGVGAPDERRRRVLLLLAFAVWVCLGRYGGWEPLIEALPASLRKFRYPSKAFFTVHFLVALLVGRGLDRLAADTRAWRRAAAAALGLGLPLCALAAVPAVLSATAATWLFPESPRPLDLAGHVARDAALGGLVCALGGGLAAAVAAGRARSGLAVPVLVIAVGLDLLRTGVGLNPMATAGFYTLSDEMTAEVARFRAAGGRIYSCEAPTSRAVRAGLPSGSEDVDVWISSVMMETLRPSFNMPWGVPTAYSADLTSLVPLWRTLPGLAGQCAALPEQVPRLRAAGVTHVLTPDPVQHPDLRLVRRAEPARIRPVAIYVYELERPLPLLSVARRVRVVADAVAARELGESTSDAEEVALEQAGMAAAPGHLVSVRSRPGFWDISVEAQGTTPLVVREAHAAGWTAAVDGAPAAIARANGRHMAVAVPAGRSHVVLRYRPPGLGAGLIASAGAAILVMWAARRRF